MIARRSLCPEKLGSNPGQGSKGINFSGWHGLDMSVTVTKRRLTPTNKQTKHLCPEIFQILSASQAKKNTKKTQDNIRLNSLSNDICIVTNLHHRSHYLPQSKYGCVKCNSTARTLFFHIIFCVALVVLFMISYLPADVKQTTGI